MMMLKDKDKNKSTKFKELDDAVRSARALRSPDAPRACAAAYTQRGRFKIRQGIARSGLCDLVRAHAHAAGATDPEGRIEPLLDALLNERLIVSDIEDVTQLAYLGEGLRVKARDIDLSVREEEDKVQLTVAKSVAFFDEAEKVALRERDEKTRNDYVAWI